MPIDKSEILSLPAEEKIALAEELWSSVEEELQPGEDEIELAEERLRLHNEAPEEGLILDTLKEYFKDKYKF